jgi:hypothetical protein
MLGKLSIVVAALAGIAQGSFRPDEQKADLKPCSSQAMSPEGF